MNISLNMGVRFAASLNMDFILSIVYNELYSQHNLYKNNQKMMDCE